MFGECNKTHIGDLVWFIKEELPVLGTSCLALIAQHARHLNLGAGHFEVHRFLGAFVLHRENNFLTRFTRDHVNRLTDTHVFGGLAVDLENDVARKQRRTRKAGVPTMGLTTTSGR